MRSFSLALVGLCMLASSIYAQDTRGNISGTLTDAQGASVTGAQITITNVATGTNVRLTTNAGGYYEAPLLLPGSYTVTAEMQGFKKTVRSGITLTLSEALQVNVQLEVGGTTESVTVSADAPMLDTASVNTGRSMTHQEILDLPVLGNNVSMLARMAPGVQSPGTTQFLVQGQVGGGSGYNMPGNVGGNEWSMDGASTNGTNRRVAIMPSPDVIDEFRIETANFDASFGHSTGLNVSTSTKSGQNAFHGSSTYQHFNQQWNAASFFVKQSRYSQIASLRAAGRTADADKLADAPMLPAGKTHNFQASVSGPVRIPKVFDGRNKVFFFLGYSKLDNQQAARPSEINYTVPTAAFREGNFSQLLRVDPVRYQVYDPISTRPDPARAGHFIRDPFPGNIVPRTRFRNPLYDFYTKRLPLPNTELDPTKDPVNNYLATGMPNNVKYESWNNRIDVQGPTNHRLFFRWLSSDFLEDAQDYTYESEPGLMAWNETRPSLSGLVDWTWTASSNTVMNVSVDATRFYTQRQRLGVRKYKPTDAGLPAYMDAKCGGSCVMPRVIWPGMTAWSGDMVLSDSVDPGPQGRQEAVKYNLTHIRGSHSIRTGIDFRRHHQTLIQNGGFTSGNFTFANNFVRRDEDGFTPAGTLGLTWATFLMGMPTGMSVDTNDTFAVKNPYYAWYGQDTWRVNRSLTVTLGLRMEYEMGPTERYNRALAYFDPNLELPIAAAAQAAYARNPLPELPASQFVVRGGTAYLGQNGRDRLWQSQLMWLPKISAAQQIGRKTVVRGGYGVYYDTLNVMNQAPDQSGFSRPTSTVLTNDFGQNWNAGDPKNGISPLTDPFPVRANGTRFDEPYRDTLGPMARVGQGVTYTPYDRVHPRVQRWRIGMQRELTSDMMVEVAYWGQYADDIHLTVRQDALQEKYWNQTNVRDNALATEMNRQVPNPFFIDNFASLRTSNPTLYQHMSTLGQFTTATIAKNRLLRPFPQMNGLNNNSVPAGEARTHAFEVSFTRRFSKGLNLNASYSRLSQRNKTTMENEYETSPRIWWPSDTARPHRFASTGIYQLPFGRGKSFAKSGIANWLAGGWQIAATFEWQPGPLLAWGNLFYRGDINSFEKDASSGEQTLERWFNTTVPFDRVANNQPAAFQARVFPRFFDGLRADGLMQWNGNLMRSFRITEGVRLELRGDAMNLQNRSQMAGPDLSPTSTNFGRITSQTSSLNRFYQVQVRVRF
ncbi:MAG: carboxypeptidase-like regulatory domain-containing protein [Bryobacteraceae bacterium]|nr:carboxypeptidase-like regulatory domain-containing protein [Bryobacteraceae bacterium]